MRGKLSQYRLRSLADKKRFWDQSSYWPTIFHTEYHCKQKLFFKQGVACQWWSWYQAEDWRVLGSSPVSSLRQPSTPGCHTCQKFPSSCAFNETKCCEAYLRILKKVFRPNLWCCNFFTWTGVVYLVLVKKKVSFYTKLISKKSFKIQGSFCVDMW